MASGGCGWAIFRGGPFQQEVQRCQSLICIQASSSLQAEWAGPALHNLHPSASPCIVLQAGDLHGHKFLSRAKPPFLRPFPHPCQPLPTTEKRGWRLPSAPTGLLSTASYPLCFPTCCQRRRRSRRRSLQGCHTCRGIRWARWGSRG